MTLYLIIFTCMQMSVWTIELILDFLHENHVHTHMTIYVKDDILWKSSWRRCIITTKVYVRLLSCYVKMVIITQCGHIWWLCLMHMLRKEEDKLLMGWMKVAYGL